MVPGIPYTPTRVCEDAMAFFTRMELVEKQFAEALRKARFPKEQTREDRAPEREIYSIGDLVWVLKPTSTSTQVKVEAKWKGPYQVLQRTGKRSYLVGDKIGGQLQVHVDQLKLYVTLLGEHGELVGLDGMPRVVDRIVAWQGGRGGIPGGLESRSRAAG